MTDLTLQLPDWLAKELSQANQEYLAKVVERGLRAVKIEEALAAYARGGITLGAAARLAEVAESELARHAYASGLEPRFSTNTLNEELA
ncbi:MAG: hypothetical protein ACT4QE_16695 [Anaerolineales bacterium]